MENVIIDEMKFFTIGKYEFQVVPVSQFNVYFLVGSLGEDVYQPMRKKGWDMNPLSLGSEGTIILYDSPRDALQDALVFVHHIEFYEKQQGKK